MQPEIEYTEARDDRSFMKMAVIAIWLAMAATIVLPYLDNLHGRASNIQMGSHIVLALIFGAFMTGVAWVFNELLKFAYDS